MNAKMAAGDRVAWIDIAKAIGLIFIITGHNIVNTYEGAKYIYWFHVPLFFILSGILHRQNISAFTFMPARFKHLMVPYLSFLSICLSARLFGYFKEITITNLLLGGNYLAGSLFFMKWWFIPCLFATQITAFFILKLKRIKVIVYIALLSYFIAVMIEWKYSFFIWGAEFNVITLPLSLELVPMALVFYLIGFLCKKASLSDEYSSKNIVIFLLLILLLLILLDYRGVISIPFFSMYGQRYGFPLINVCIPVLCFILVRYLSIVISKVYFIKNIFIGIGQAAIPIMFLHIILPALVIPGIDKVMRLHIDCIVSRIALGILLPYSLYCLLKQFTVTKKMFLGIWN